MSRQHFSTRLPGGGGHSPTTLGGGYRLRACPHRESQKTVRCQAPPWTRTGHVPVTPPPHMSPVRRKLRTGHAPGRLSARARPRMPCRYHSSPTNHLQAAPKPLKFTGLPAPVDLSRGSAPPGTHGRRRNRTRSALEVYLISETGTTPPTGQFREWAAVARAPILQAIAPSRTARGNPSPLPVKRTQLSA